MNTKLSENEIDRLIIAQADDDDAWDTPIRVNKKGSIPLRLSLPFEVVSDKNVLDGTPVFRGTRVPVSEFIENLENGISVDQFIESFPTVKRDQAIKILEFFKNSLTKLKVA